MKIYLASRYSRHLELQRYADDLRALGHTITARWIQGGHEGDHSVSDAMKAAFGEDDYHDLEEAYLSINFTDGPNPEGARSRGGRHIEFGLALAWCKWQIIVGPLENVFHYYAKERRNLVQFDDWKSCRDFIATHELTGHGWVYTGPGGTYANVDVYQDTVATGV